MGGSYAYQMGYSSTATATARSATRAPAARRMLADAPSDTLKNLAERQSRRLRSERALSRMATSQYVKRSTLPAEHQDLIYLNDAGEEAAGLDRFDTVLGRSEATPGIITLAPVQ